MELNTHLKMEYDFELENYEAEVIVDLACVLRELSSLFDYIDNFEDLEDYIQWSYNTFDEFLIALATETKDTIGKIIELVNY